MKLLLPHDYIHQATRQMKTATKRINLISMVIADEPATHALIAELAAAARRGIPVTVAADIFTYGEVGGSLLFVRYYSQTARLATQMAKTLREAGVKFHWLGRGRISIYTGRTHTKWCVVDDTSYTFGGVNMHGDGISNRDYMFRIESPQLADRLVREQGRIQKIEQTSGNYPSTAYELNDDTVYFDGGIVGQSIIYRRACELAHQSVDTLLVSQYCPNGKLARILRKKKHQLYFNQPHQARSFNKVLIKFSLLTTGLTTLYTKKRYLHAKFIIFTMKDGSKVALTGSHNFSFTGVVFGTREIALETKDPAVIAQLESFYEQYVA